MLRRLDPEDFDKYIGAAYRLVLDPARTGYPAYFDGIKTREDFIARERQGLTDENEEILLFEDVGGFAGWIHLYAQPEERYLDTVSFCAERNSEQALDELMSHIAARWPGIRAYLGFPAENETAIRHLQSRGFRILDESWNNVLPLDAVEEKAAPKDVTEITRENFDPFRALHTLFESEMYWTSDRILAALNSWRIFARMDGQTATAAIYTRRGELAEVFGVDSRSEDPVEFRALLDATSQAAKKDGSRHLVFFGEEQQQRDILAAGFRCVGKYVLLTNDRRIPESTVEVIPYDDAYRDDMIFMVLSAKDALGRIPRLNPDLLTVKESYPDKGDRFWLAVDAGRVVGCIGYSSVPGTTEVVLHRLYVKPDRKRQGIGTLLLETAEAHLRSIGKTAVRVHLGEPREQWFESYAFYPKHGYMETEPRYMVKKLGKEGTI